MTAPTPPTGAPYRSYETVVALDEIIGKSLEEWLDFLCELVGAPLLMDISYTVTGVNAAGHLLVTVVGDPSMQDAADREDGEA